MTDNITTDDIIPADTNLISLRSNIPELSKHTFERIDENFYSRIKNNQGGIIITGENYGQGSSREHAALVLMNLGVKLIIAKSYARIHKRNLINFGILALRFNNFKDYDKLKQDDILLIEDLQKQVKHNEIIVKVVNKNFCFLTFLDISKRNLDIILNGGLLNYFYFTEAEKISPITRRSSFFGFLPWDTFSKITLPKAATREYKNISPLTLLPEDKITSPNRSPAFFCFFLNFSKSSFIFFLLSSFCIKS